MEERLVRAFSFEGNETSLPTAKTVAEIRDIYEAIYVGISEAEVTISTVENANGELVDMAVFTKRPATKGL